MGAFATGVGSGLAGTPISGGQDDQQQPKKRTDPFSGIVNSIADKLQPPGQARAGMPGVQAPVTQAAPTAQPAQTGGFHGLVPMAMQYYQNHEAKMRDAQAKTHLDALQDPNLTPEQRQYHISGVQGIYKNQPEVLQQLGIAPIPNASPTPPPITPIPNANPNAPPAIMPTSGGGR